MKLGRINKAFIPILKKKHRDPLRWFYTFLGFILLLAFWQGASLYFHGLIIAAPKDTFVALIKILTEYDFLKDHFWVTLKRVMIGVGLALCIGFGLGVLAGLNRAVKNILEPLRWVLMSVPAVVIVVVAMLWFGMSDSMVIFIATVFLAPIVYVNVVRGFESLDPKYREMGQVYGFNFWLCVKDIYIPAICAPLISACAIVVCNGVRVAILAEVMGANEGIGFRLTMARSNFNIPDLFACVILSLLIVGFLEFLFLKPLENYLLKWKL